MSCNHRSPGQRVHLAGSVALPLCLILSACGGGSGEIASIPPPPPLPLPTPTPTPTPTFDVKTSLLESPATRPGTYDVIGKLTVGGVSRAIAPGEFSMSVGHYFSDDPLIYTLNAPAGIFPAALTSTSVNQPFISWTFKLPPEQSLRYDNQPAGAYCCQYLGEHLTATTDSGQTQVVSYDFTQGSSGSSQQINPNAQVRASLYYDIGYSYVAMGEWSWGMVDLNGATVPGSQSGELLFVDGERTPAAGIPVSGTATYDAHSLFFLSSNLTPGIPFTLTADFGQRTISTLIDQDYRYQPNGDLLDYPAPGIHVSGSAPFSNSGSFDIPLTGTANYSGAYPLNTPTTPPTQQVTGMMDGAFFGPHAENVGGTFALDRSDGSLLLQDAFVGQQRHP